MDKQELQDKGWELASVAESGSMIAVETDDPRALLSVQKHHRPGKKKATHMYICMHTTTAHLHLPQPPPPGTGTLQVENLIDSDAGIFVPGDIYCH